MKRNASSRKRTRLFRRRIVSRFGVNLERRQSLRRNQFHFYLTPFAVVSRFHWTVSQHILVAQLNSYFCGNISQIVWIIDGKSPPAGQFGDFAQQGRPQLFFLALEIMVIQADGINHYIRFFHQGLDLALGIAAVIVATVGDDE